MEKSYVMVKPEFANYPQVIDYVKSQLQSVGMQIVKEGYIKYDALSARKHYTDHVGKEFYQGLEEYITSDKAYGMEVQGEDAIAKIRKLVGATKNPDPHTIRYEVPKMLNLPLRITQNVVHASDSVKSAERELEIFYTLLKK